jgi:hypothetical protein
MHTIGDVSQLQGKAERAGSMRTIVHGFKTWNGSNDETVLQPLKSTEERIKSVGGEIVPGTREIVDTADLDGYGRYDPNRRLDR